MRWIPIEDAKPKSDTYILVCLCRKFRKVSYYFYDSYGQWFSTDYDIWDKMYTDEVTHWMPLPDPPLAKERWTMPKNSERAKRILEALDRIEKEIRGLQTEEADLQDQLQIIWDEEREEKIWGVEDIQGAKPKSLSRCCLCHRRKNKQPQFRASAAAPWRGWGWEFFWDEIYTWQVNLKRIKNSYANRSSEIEVSSLWPFLASTKIRSQDLP